MRPMCNVNTNLIVNLLLKKFRRTDKLITKDRKEKRKKYGEKERKIYIEER
jgi:hypothetical protein